MPTPESLFYIIEHPTRGVLMDLDWTPSETQFGRFGRDKMRGEALRFSTMEQAIRARERIHPPKLRLQCQVRSSHFSESLHGSWPVVA